MYGNKYMNHPHKKQTIVSRHLTATLLVGALAATALRAQDPKFDLQEATTFFLADMQKTHDRKQGRLGTILEEPKLFLEAISREDMYDEELINYRKDLFEDTLESRAWKTLIFIGDRVRGLRSLTKAYRWIKGIDLPESEEQPLKIDSFLDRFRHAGISLAGGVGFEDNKLDWQHSRYGFRWSTRQGDHYFSTKVYPAGNDRGITIYYYFSH